MRISLGISVLLFTTACGSGSLTLGDGPSKNCPGFGVSAEELVIDAARLDGPNEVILTVTNNCLDDVGDLQITVAVAGDPNFAATPADALMQPQDSVDIVVTYTALGYASAQAELQIVTNIEELSTVTIPIQAATDPDQDGDGVDAIEAGGTDCDDTDASISPSAAETYYDGVDSNCDGLDDFDQDRDGFQRQPEGGDCDDTNAQVNPDASETADGLDNDCDGWVDEDQLRPGDVLITEIMNDPVAVFDTSGEWFEVLNRSPRQINLVNWQVRDFNGDSFTIEEPLLLEPGQRMVLGVEEDPQRNGGVAVDYVYPRESFDLENVTDALGLQVAGEVVALVEYDASWRQVAGRSLQLDGAFEDPSSASVKGFWCLSSATISGDDSDLGTPGGDNRLCPGVDHDGDGYSIIDGDCNDANGDISPGAKEVWNGIDDDCDGTTDVSDLADVESGYLDGERRDYLGYAAGLSVGDVDHDGDMELIVGSTRASGTIDGLIYTLDAADASTWADPAYDVDEAQISVSHPYNAMGLVGRAMADNDGDGKVDLVVGGSAGYGSSESTQPNLLMFADGALAGNLDEDDATAAWLGVRGAYDANRVASHLDVNGDGTAEIFFVDPAATTDIGFSVGAVHLLDADGATGTQDFADSVEVSYTGSRAYGRFGTAVDGGDLDGDGYDELIGCGSVESFSNVGVCYIVAGASSYADADTMKNAAGVAIEGRGGLERLGFAHRMELADFDGNTKPDLVIGSPYQDEALVFFDAADLSGSYDTSDADVVIKPRTSPSYFGMGFAAGDFDGDGTDDLAVGASDILYYTGGDEAGQVWIWSGSDIAASSKLSEVDAWASVIGGSVSDGFGQAILAADLESDGVDDLVITAPAYNTDAGRVSIILLD